MPLSQGATLQNQTMLQITNEDCMDLMGRYPDGYFDLAIVDPPYGIGEDGKSNHSRGKLTKSKKYTPKSWDKEPPSIEYFAELRRVSQNQIIWGANHFGNVPHHLLLVGLFGINKMANPILQIAN